MKKRIKKFFHHFFVPGHHNNHHAPVVSHAALTGFLILTIVSFVVLRNIGLQTGDVLGFATDVSVDRVYSLTNTERLSNNVPSLSFNPLLAAAAEAKAHDMFAKGYWSHFGPNGESPWNFILGTGYQYEYAGENLAKNYMVSSGVVDAWMHSKTHKDNILNPHYDEMGIAVVNGNLSGEDTTLVVQMFGSKSAFQKQVESSSTSIASRTTPLLPTVTPEQHRLDVVPVRGGVIPTKNVAQESLIGDASVPSFALENSIKTPSINLFPAFRLLSSISIAFLMVVFMVDLYHISKTQFHKHRGKHLAHIIFLGAILIGVFFLGKGAIL